VSIRWATLATYGFAAAAVVMATLGGILSGSTHGSARAWWIVTACFAACLAFGVPALDRRKISREGAATEDLGIALMTAMNDSLDPIVRQLGRLATVKSRDRDAVREQIGPMVLNSAAELVGHDRVRACWFDLDRGPPRALLPKLHVGRSDAPNTNFVEGTPEGDAAFEMIETNTNMFYPDVSAEPPPGWRPGEGHDYVTFVSVPVVAGNVAFGMLTVDSLHIGDLGEHHVAMVRLLAGLLADALAFAP
jgi:GAF domain-containing protein